MSPGSWIRNLFARPVVRPLRKRPPRARPALEALEDRTVPSTLTVNTTADEVTPGDGKLSLREAIAAAASGDRIVFASSVTGTIQESAALGELFIAKSLTINGPGAATLAVSGNPTNRVLEIAACFTDVISGLTIENGSTGGDGGGIFNSGNLTLKADTVTNNLAGGFGGGGIANGGTTTLTDCTVSGNSATNGGGLNNGFLGTLTVNNSTLSGNSASDGGGIANQGTLSVASSNIVNNTATAKGGGLSTTGGSATLTGCFINTNQVLNPAGTALGGGIDCENSTLSLTNCTVNANQANGATALGGGIYALNSTVTVTNSVVNGNKANGSVVGEGGGIYSFNGILTLVNSTVKGNNASTAFDDIFDVL
jgi:CSLREA domain-containing protein